MRQLVLVLLFAVACVWAQERCCAPELHTLREFRTTSYEENGRTVTETEVSERAYDYNEERFAHEGEIRRANGTTERFKVIELIKRDERFFIQNDKCTKEKPRETRVDRCVAQTANFTGSYFIGDHQLECETWADNVRDDEAEGYGSFTFTRGNCIPVASVFSGVIKESGREPRRDLSVRTYSDFRKGVEDPGRWFEPPSSCSS
ncbi:development-specific protein LVN1.2-like [Amphiura filiformis]|uniref:development-specific protein LVN1.2-like n=1 Tax=Amphiura filiformis TaxID=82378 RepID=UPI003B211A87